MASASKGVENVSWPLNETWSAPAISMKEVTPVRTVPASQAKLISRPCGSEPSEDLTVRAAESSYPVALSKAACRLRCAAFNSFPRIVRSISYSMRVKGMDAVRADVKKGTGQHKAQTPTRTRARGKA